MDEFLEKLQEDQRRMRKFLRSHGLHFKKMGACLAAVRQAGGRVFVLGEPPLDGLMRLVADEYLVHLPAIPLDLDRPRPNSLDPDDSQDPPASAREAAARQVARHLHRGDLLLAFLHEGADRETRVVICHWHVQLVDPLYRAFTGDECPQKREGGRTLTRDAVLRWVRAQDPGDRWRAATHAQFASKLLSCAHAAGLITRTQDPRPLATPRVTNGALGYLLHILRDTMDKRPADGSPAVMMAMGPGFCSELVLMQWQ